MILDIHDFFSYLLVGQTGGRKEMKIVSAVYSEVGKAFVNAEWV